MDDALRQQLVARHAVADWPPSTPGLIAAPEPASLDVGGWLLVRSRPIQMPDARAAWHVLLQPADGREHVMLRVDIIETTGPQAARDQLLNLLGEFKSPHIERRLDPPVGDIAFGPAGGATLVFARANVVVMIRNAEREIVPVTPHARRIDDQLRTLSDAQSV